jgi:hypothetical protein
MLYSSTRENMEKQERYNCLVPKTALVLPEKAEWIKIQRIRSFIG